MVFSTPMFVFGFLPVFLAAYYTLPKAVRNWLILLASTLFYAWWRADALIVLYAIAGGSYLAGLVATRTSRERVKTWAVRLGVTFNLAILGWFKYTTFLLGNLNTALGGDALTVPEIILPIGLSFLAFQSISYIFDVARGDAPPAKKLSDFLAFSSLFPQLIAGPVLRYKDLAHQFEERTHSIAIFSRGLRRFIEGLAMKLLIADSVAPLADRMFALADPTMAEAWLGAVAYSVQLLFDFAGYSAMAIGLGLMIGFRFPENFDAPYTSRSITEFWRRWHISLSTWFRDYLYIPLGGNRGSTPRQAFNLMATMLIAGLWHGASWNFVVWGGMHGLALGVQRVWTRAGRLALPRLVSTPLTLSWVILAWTWFRAADLETAWSVTQAQFLLGDGESLLGDRLIYLLAGLALIHAVSFSGALRKLWGRLPEGVFALAYGVLWALALRFSQVDTVPFIYFQF